MSQNNPAVYETLHQIFLNLGVPVHMLAADSGFTISSLKELDTPKPFVLPPSLFRFFVFNFVKDAAGCYMINEHRFPLQPRTIYFTCPGQHRSFEYSFLEDVHLITLNEDFLKENVHPEIYVEFPFLLTGIFPPGIVNKEIFHEFESLYQLIYREYFSHSPIRNQLIGVLFKALLLKFKEYFLLNDTIEEGDRTSVIVEVFKRHLEKHYGDLIAGRVKQVFRKQDYADAQNLHPNYLNNVIKKKTGKPISTWIIEKTLAEAKFLLQHSNVFIKEIALRLGFTQPAHFNNYFKKYLHSSPGAYRKFHKVSEL